MKDVTGNDLAIGDKVAMIPQNGYTCELSVGIITGFTKEKVRIQVTTKAWSYSENTCLKFPMQVSKVFIKI